MEEKGRGAVSKVKTRKKKVITNVPSKSLLGVRKKKGRLSLKKKQICAANWFYFSPDYHVCHQSQVKTKKKKSSPQTGYVLVRNIGTLPPNLGEDQKKMKKKRSSPQIGTDFGRNFGFIDYI